MNIKIIAFITSAVVFLSSCSTRPATPEHTPMITQSPVSTEISSTPAPTPSDLPPLTFSLDDIPAYQGAAYITLNDNIPYFSKSDMTTKTFEHYSSLDHLGRCGIAYANIWEILKSLGTDEELLKKAQTEYANKN